MTDADFLRSLAQNDYMIDGHYLADGRELLRAADVIDGRDARIENIARIAHDGGLLGLDPYEALNLIRALTVGYWDGSGSLDDRKGRSAAAITAAREGK